MTATTIHRHDYRPLPWRVGEIELHFMLDAARTEVRNRMRVVRNGQVEPGPLRLDADGVERVSLSVDGAPATILREFDGGLEIDIPGDEAWVEVVTRIAPADNTALSGLYASRGGLFTQCEAEGFRRITCFPDRPDVMARYTVTLEADAARYPVLLSNGNLVDAGPLAEGRHFARWVDPFPKPCYLFALVAADLKAIERSVRTMSGREVLLQVWVEDGMQDRADFALDSLERALRWDETRFGLELDLDRYMIVAVSDFNMGAMENKGLNIFNAKYVLAKPEAATDADYEHIESVVAHEYFHNWTGNRVTCRDWFQLTLKEGLTVFRDQQFSADMLGQAAAADAPAGLAERAAASARAVKRIDDVRVLRTAQFPEDAGPMAHPIRPDSYQEINNFYTATVYEKGAEVIRMLHTLLGEEGFRNGMDLYFSYFDGQAVTCDDFVAAFAEANGVDLQHFMRWYAQAGTPRLKVEEDWSAEQGRYRLRLSQRIPGQPDAPPLLIPVAIALLDAEGRELPLRLAGEAAPAGTTRVLRLAEATMQYDFVGLAERPVPSLLRGFSAPVVLEIDEDDARLAFRLAHDSDPFNRWDAGQRLAERTLLAMARGEGAPDALIAAYARVLADDGLDPAFRAQVLTLPSEVALLETMQPADPVRLRAASIRLASRLGEALAVEWLALYRDNQVSGEYRYHPVDAGKRALRALALRYLCAAGRADGLALARSQLLEAGNMSERHAALIALVQSPAQAEREAALEVFYLRHRDDALVLDKWFALQAGAWRWRESQPAALDTVRELLAHPAFSRANPNKVYALLGSFFRANPGEFHREDGAGYQFWAEQVLLLDAANPQVAARMARSLDNWRRLAPVYAEQIRPALEQVAAARQLSADVREVVDKALA